MKDVQLHHHYAAHLSFREQFCINFINHYMSIISPYILVTQSSETYLQSEH